MVTEAPLRSSFDEEDDMLVERGGYEFTFKRLAYVMSLYIDHKTDWTQVPGALNGDLLLAPDGPVVSAELFFRTLKESLSHIREIDREQDERDDWCISARALVDKCGSIDRTARAYGMSRARFRRDCQRFGIRASRCARSHNG